LALEPADPVLARELTRLVDRYDYDAILGLTGDSADEGS